MKNKKGMMVEGIVRLALTAIALIIVVTIGYNMASRASWSDADVRFDSFIKETAKLSQGQSKELSLSVDDEGAIFAFVKETDKIRLFGGPREDKVEYLLKRPKECPQGSACLCLCTGISSTKRATPIKPEAYNEKTGELYQGAQYYETGELACTRRLKCEQLSGIDMNQYTSENFFPSPESLLRISYTHDGGFVISRKWSFTAHPADRLFTLRVEKNAGSIAISVPKVKS